MYKIDWTTKALKQTRKLKDAKASADIYDGVQVLTNYPDCNGVKALVNHEHQYRLRVGRYRVFFNVAGDEINVISIEEVKKRDERTY